MKENGSEKYPAEAGGGEQKDTGFTCREVYEEGAALLQDLEDGRLDARLLLEHYCGIPAHRLLADPETAVKAEEREAFLAVQMIADSGKLISMDLVEVNPILDERNKTGILASDIIQMALGKKVY